MSYFYLHNLQFFKDTATKMGGGNSDNVQYTNMDGDHKKAGMITPSVH